MFKGTQVLDVHGHVSGPPAVNSWIDMGFASGHVGPSPWRIGDGKSGPRADGGALIAVLNQLVGHLHADVLLGFEGAAADVRRNEKVVVIDLPTGVLRCHARGNRLIGCDLNRRPAPNVLVARHQSNLPQASHANAGKILTCLKATSYINSKVPQFGSRVGPL